MPVLVLIVVAARCASALQGGLACRPGIHSRPAPPGNKSPGYKPNPAEAGCNRFALRIVTMGRRKDPLKREFYIRMARKFG
jgi:hypothetical protein